MPDQLHKWAHRFSSSMFARLALARAFVMNPEVLVLHSPCAHFNDHEVETIMTLLKTHVEKKGFELAENEIKFRRPRTVFMTSVRMAALEIVDDVYKVKDGGIERIPKDAVKNAVNIQDLA